MPTKHSAAVTCTAGRATTLLLAMALGCSSPTEPTKSPPTLEVVLGKTATDTIGARLTVPLTVVLHDSSGKSPYRAPITFTVLPIPGAPADPLPAAPAIVAPTSYVYPPGPQTAMKEWTDSSGRAAVTVQLGTVAASIRIAIVSDSLPASDTVTYTVLPGNPTTVGVAPADSALYVGASYRLTSRVVDRANNVRSDAVSYAIDSSADVAGVQATGQLTAAVVGRARARVAVEGWPLSTVAHVSVVPRGTIAALLGGYATSSGIARVNLDGSGFRMLSTNATGGYGPLSWSPDGSNLVFSTADPWSSRLMRVDTLGNASMITHVGVRSSESWPRYSSDGKSLFYTAGLFPDSLDTYRIAADGSGTPERVTPLRPGSTRYWHASPSPDGSHLVYSEAGFELAIVSLADTSARELSAPGWGDAPRYSPDGRWIAYSDGYAYQLDLVGADGSGFRTLSPVGTRMNGWSDWSPDGAWVIARRGSASDEIVIIRVADGVVIPLPYSRDLYGPAWRPVP